MVTGAALGVTTVGAGERPVTGTKVSVRVAATGPIVLLATGFGVALLSVEARTTLGEPTTGGFAVGSGALEGSSGIDITKAGEIRTRCDGATARCESEIALAGRTALDKDGNSDEAVAGAVFAI
jgi:hypothetical protein